MFKINLMNCMICNGELDLFSNDSYFHLPVSFCKNCNFYSTGNPETIKKQLEKLYSKDYWIERKAESSIKSNFEDPDSLSKKRSWESQIKYCKPFLKNKKKILEIGAGGGQSLEWFEEKNFDITGIEPDQNNVNLINQRLKKGKCIAGFIEDMHIEDKFDVIWMSHVLEHLVNPKKFLENTKTLLNKSGIFFIEVPNAENLDLLNKTIFSDPHTFHFSKNSLIKLAENAGYTVLSCDYFRPAKKVEGVINKIKKLFTKKDFYSCYPRIRSKGNVGRDLRIVLQVS